MAEQEIYLQQKLYVRLAHIIAIFMYLWTMTISFSMPIADAIKSMCESSVIVIALYAGAFYIALVLWRLPISAYDEFWLERRFHNNEQRFPHWLKQHFIGHLKQFGLFFMAMQVLFFFLETHPRTWWIWITVVWVVGREGIWYYGKIFLRPWLAKDMPLGNPDWADHLKLLCSRSGVEIDVVLTGDLNNIHGERPRLLLRLMASPRQLIIDETDLREFAPAEIEMQLALQLAAYYFQQWWRQLLLRCLSVFGVLCASTYVLDHTSRRFGFLTIFDVAATPLLGFAVACFGSLALIINNALNRRFVRQADEYALKLTGNPEALISLLIRWLEVRPEPPRPSPWMVFALYSRPPIARRMQRAQDFAQNVRWLLQR